MITIGLLLIAAALSLLKNKRYLSYLSMKVEYVDGTKKGGQTRG